MFFIFDLFLYRLGLDKKVLAGILNTSSGRCWSSDTYNPVPGVIEGYWLFLDIINFLVILN